LVCLTRLTPRYTPLPYTTLFRSGAGSRTLGRRARGGAARAADAVRSAVAVASASRLQAALLRRPPDARCRLPSGHGMGLAHRSRSEEHTSELQSRENLVCRLLLG